MGIILASVYADCNEVSVLTKKGNANFQTFCSETHEFEAQAVQHLSNQILGKHRVLCSKITVN